MFAWGKLHGADGLLSRFKGVPPFPAAATPALGATVGSMISSMAFGFMTLERDGANWKIVERDTRGAPRAVCTLANGKAACTPVLPSAPQ